MKIPHYQGKLQVWSFLPSICHYWPLLLCGGLRACYGPVSVLPNVLLYLRLRMVVGYWSVPVM